MIRMQVKLYFSLLAVLVLALTLCSWSLFKQEEKIAQLKKNRFDFYALINHLEKNHNDFNYIVNRHIVNDQENFEAVLKPFIALSSLENIEQLRSSVLKEFGFNTNNTSISDFNKQQYQSFLKKINISSKVYDEVEKATQYSQQVLKLNIQAINLYYGFVKNDYGAYVKKVQPSKEKAIDILYNEQYKNLNHEIRNIANDLNEYIQTLMYQKIEVKKDKEDLYKKIEVFLLGAIILMIVVGVLYTIYRVVRPLNQLIAWTKQVEKGDYALDNKHIYNNEIGILMHSFDAMAQKVKQDMHLLEKASLTDQLTQLYNRRALDNRLEEMYENFVRYQTTFSVIIVDIDFFKKVNDTYGHDVGDSVLKEFSQLLRTHVRQVDIVGRWGGEEFLIICPNTNHLETKIVAENVRKAIEEHRFEVVGQKSASLGTAQIEKGLTLSQLIEKADQALYFAKENGRNQVA